MQRPLVSRSSTSKSQLPKGQKKGARGRKPKAAAAVTTINAWETDPGLGNQPSLGAGLVAVKAAIDQIKAAASDVESALGNACPAP